MYLSDSWIFLVELKAFPGECPETVGVVPVDLSEEDDRGDIESAKDVRTGELFRALLHTRQGRPDRRRGFVRHLLDANLAFDGFTEDDVARLKEVYGV